MFGPYSGLTTGTISFTATPYDQAVPINTQQQDVAITPYEDKKYEFGLTPTSEAMLITNTARLNVDGEEIRIIKKQPI